MSEKDRKAKVDDAIQYVRMDKHLFETEPMYVKGFVEARLKIWEAIHPLPTHKHNG